MTPALTKYSSSSDPLKLDLNFPWLILSAYLELKLFCEIVTLILE